MPTPFTSTRSREQLARILAHVSFPGLGVVLDRDGLVVAASGGVAAATARDVATAFGTRPDAPVDASAGFLGDGYHVHRRELPAGYALLVVLPCEVTLLTGRLEKATHLLERMLVAGAVVSGGSAPTGSHSGSGGGGAPALVGLGGPRPDDEAPS